MKKSKNYYHCKFSITTIRKASDFFIKTLNSEKITEPQTLEITKNNETWDYDNMKEFLAEYKTSTEYKFYHFQDKKEFYISGDNHLATIIVESNKRDEIEGIFNIFEENLDESIIKIEKEPIKIFIGHGHNPQWRDLKDHLHEKHGFEVITYEIGPRAGLSIKDVLKSMINESSFALLLLTGEDLDNEGNLHARENVIHELGLFQGSLGFEKAIAILEKEVTEFSNILGINQVRFSKGNIKETFGEILSIIRREFE